MTDGQEQESEIQGEEEQEEGDGRAERADQENGGEDEPASKVESNGVVEVVLVGVSVTNGESTGGQDDGERDPESTVRGERGGTKGVADGHFPGGGRLAACILCVTGTGIG